MAKATTNVHLELTHEEALALATVLALVGGDTRLSARKHTQAVYDALAGEGFDWGSAKEKRYVADGDIFFRNFKDEGNT